MATSVVVVALVASLLSLVSASRAPAASALQIDDSLVINELVAANDSYFDSFGDTPDWIEIENTSATSINLAGWTIADNGGPWVFPSRTLGSGQRILVFASGRDLTGAELHTDFSLKRSGESLTLANPAGQLVDSIVYGALDDDVAYGRGSNGGVGILLSPTPAQPNSALAPSSVAITTPPQTFLNSLSVSMTATTRPGEQVRFTTDSTPVTASSQVYDGPFSISTSTVVRAAVVGNGVVGPESNAGYIAVSTSIENFTSDIPLVIVHSTGAVGTDVQDAIVTVIDRGANGRAGVFDEADYTGFAGLRIRGASSVGFPKKQYKFELWGDRLGDEVDADLLGLGSDSDWGLYAPGRFDRAMINNPFMYELGKQIGVIAPDYQFVELYIEDNPSATVGDGDYRGLYVLRETIKVSDDRVDITKHTDTSAGPDGGYILRYDWSDSCCTNLEQTIFGSYVAVDTPGVGSLTSTQQSYIDNWWDDLAIAADSSFGQADDYIDFDSYIDHWLLEILAMDVDVLRASHYMHMDANGQLQGGPLWDYDRALGGADDRVNELFEAQAWKPNGNSGHSYLSNVYQDLWDMPEVQVRLRARWAELRAPGAPLSDTELETLIFTIGGEISEAYTREDALWGSNPSYGSRFGGLNGELNHMRDWVVTRTAWLDDQFLTTSSPPTITAPASDITFGTNVAMGYQVQASSPRTMFYSATGLPEGLSINENTGLISGTVGYGDSYGTFPAQVTVTTDLGASATEQFTFVDPAFATAGASRMVLNEHNGVAPGQFLGDAGSDSAFGTVGGNGGDWFELVTINDNLDLRGWRFDVWSNNELGDVVQSASLRLGQDELLRNIRAGTIITVAESVPEDLSYDPLNGDWTINLQANDAGDGSLWINQTNFDTNHKKWRLVIRDEFGAIAGFIGGETAAFEAETGGNLSSSEVLGLGVDPAALATSYRQGTQSTFGSPNVIDGGVQDFSALRPEIVAPGDVNCNEALNVTDALMIAQFSVGNRTSVDTCPLGDPATQIYGPVADVNGSGSVNVTDALLVAQCSVGVPNTLCPN